MISHKTQTQPFNCVSACIAMITGEDVDSVTEKFHNSFYLDQSIDESDYFKEIDLPHQVMLATTRTLYKGFIYTLCVPSLNIIAGNHSIVIRCPETGEPQLFDPNKGREGVKYYVLGEPENEFEVKLKSWVPVVKISEIHLAEFRR